jgi:hypothetical protein
MQPVMVEGFEGRQLAVQPAGLFTSSKLFVDGQPAPPGAKRGQVLLRRNDGREVVASFKNSLPDPVPLLVVDGKEIRLAEPLAWYEWIWVGMPLVLILLGGAVGGALGGVATVINAHLFRSPVSGVTKYVLSGLVSFACVAGWLVVGVVLTMMRMQVAPR